MWGNYCSPGGCSVGTAHLLATWPTNHHAVQQWEGLFDVRQPPSAFISRLHDHLVQPHDRAEGDAANNMQCWHECSPFVAFWKDTQTVFARDLPAANLSSHSPALLPLHALTTRWVRCRLGSPRDEPPLCRNHSAALSSLTGGLTRSFLQCLAAAPLAFRLVYNVDTDIDLLVTDAVGCQVDIHNKGGPYSEPGNLHAKPGHAPRPVTLLGMQVTPPLAVVVSEQSLWATLACRVPGQWWQAAIRMHG